MKNIKFLLLLTVALGAIGFSGCSGTDEDPIKVGPTLNFLGGSEYISQDANLTAGETFKVGINSSHSINIESFKVTLSTNGGAAGVLFDSTFKSKTFDYVFTATTGAVAQSEKYTFILKDKDGTESTKSITITNKGNGGAALNTYTGGATGEPFRVWNFKGAKAGAFDLVLGTNQTLSDPKANKDIQDSILTSEVTSKGVNWQGRWGSRNGTTFKKVASPFDNINNEGALQDAWDNAGTELSVLLVNTGDVIVAKLRGGSELVLIKIKSKTSTPSDNLDYVEFEYKKK